MCSNDTTFELKEAETSNSMLLMPPMGQGTVIEQADGRILKKQEVICKTFSCWQLMHEYVFLFSRFLVFITPIMR